ncbi:MFS transporter [Fictibacillus gelatini]|uniref:MFS transporter n=1 Tax=Fictibacillus gelatini TaxID=225985 RepID=UPI000478FCBF|nr:MFS transporter [Fictibacillus gelatini]
MERIEVQHKSSRLALHSKSFTIFMAGSFVTRIGDWLDLVVLNWAVLQFTNSPLHLGLMNACRLAPTFFFSVPAGILADRYDRRKLLISIQIGTILLTFCLGYLAGAKPPFWLFAMVVAVRSSLAAMDTPIRNALLPSLVSERSIASAIAINTSVINLSRMIGPAIAGALLPVIGIAHLFYMNAVATFGVLFSLCAIRYSPIPNRNQKKGEKATLREAAGFIKSHPVVQSLLLLAIVPMVFGFPYTTLMPLFSRDLLQLGPEGFGMLLTISSIGAIVGTTWLSFGKEVKRPGKWLIGSIMAFGLSLLLFIGIQNVPIAGVAMFFVGLSSQIYRTMSRITLQLQVPDGMRGRILSIALMDRGFIPLGAIMIGAIAAQAGALLAGIVMGLGCIVTTFLIAVSRRQIWKM